MYAVHYLFLMFFATRLNVRNEHEIGSAETKFTGSRIDTSDNIYSASNSSSDQAPTRTPSTKHGKHTGKSIPRVIPIRLVIAIVSYVLRQIGFVNCCTKAG